MPQAKKPRPRKRLRGELVAVMFEMEVPLFNRFMTRALKERRTKRSVLTAALEHYLSLPPAD